MEVDQKAKFSKLKSSFLYVLVGGLIISALISVSAILIGEFNEVIQRALGTTITLVISSLIVLAIMSADKHNTLGKSIILTTILGVVIVNMLISSLGIWGILSGDALLNAYSVYMLLIGTAFAVTGALRLQIAGNKTLTALSYASVGFVAVFSLSVLPWILVDDSSNFVALYYRVVAALSILASTLFVVTAIIQRVALGQQPTKVKKVSAPGGIVAIYVVTGVIVLWVWLGGFVSFTSSAARVDQPAQTEYEYQEPKYETEYTPNR